MVSVSDERDETSIPEADQEAEVLLAPQSAEGEAG